MNFKMIPPSELNRYANNPNAHSRGQISQIANSIKEFGFNVPIVIDENNEVKAGHGRLEAALILGMTEVPTIQVQGLTTAQWKAFVITDNKLNRNSEWDEGMLKLEMQELIDVGFDLSITGFSGQELNDLLSDIDETQNQSDPDDVPVLKDEDYRCEPGELWQLGKHVLMIGDSTNEKDVDKLMQGETAQAMWIDPPYNVDYESKDGQKIKNDKMENDEFLIFLSAIFKNAYNHMDVGAPFYVAHSSMFAKFFILALENTGFLLKQTLVWVKNNFVLGRQDYQWQHEPILYGWKPGAAHKWYGQFDKKTVQEIGDGEPKPLAKHTKAELLEILKGAEQETTVIRVPKPMRSAMHPTMKPIELIKPQIKNSTTLNDTVIDLCAGSGSTLIACEILKRKARVMEYDPKYGDAIIRRFEEFTGEAARIIHK